MAKRDKRTAGRRPQSHRATRSGHGATTTNGRPKAAPSPTRKTLPLESAAVRRLALIGLVVWALIVIGVRFAEPILDGDLFWHLKYAGQMIARGVLIPDHTLYSWTPVTNDVVYCTWLGDFLLYGLYKLGGLTALFAFRYLCLAACAALLTRFAWSRGIRNALIIAAVVLVSLLGSIAGTIIKPEIMSLVLFQLVIFSRAMGRQADRDERDPRGWFLAVPAILVIWVNTHGEFIFAAPFLIATFVGEVATRWLAPKRALSVRGLRWMAAAWAGCGLAVFVSPYGWRYPAELFAEFVLHAGEAPGGLAWNSAYQSVLSGGFNELSGYGLLIAAALLGLGLAAGRRLVHADWGLALAVAISIPLYCMFIRTTPYLAVLFGYAAFELLSLLREKSVDQDASQRRQLEGYGAAAVLLCASALAFWGARSGNNRSWIGFGIGYQNPVVEAEFLDASRLGPRLYNAFDSGGYLLWRLDPTYKVMIDPRYFPYRAWFSAYDDFSKGRNFAEFVKAYPADTAIIDLAQPAFWWSFLRSKDWRLAFYGPTAAVFVDRAVTDQQLARNFAPGRFDHLRNGKIALDVFNFAVIVGDFPTAWKALDCMETRYPYQVGPVALHSALALRDGYRRLGSGDYDSALPLFIAAKARPLQGWREAVIRAVLIQRATAKANGDAAAVERSEAALRDLSIPSSRR